MELLEFKDIKAGGVTDVDVKNKVVTGYLSRFDNTDLDNDVIVKGAFKRSLDTRRNNILFLNQHKWDQPHGLFDVLKEDSNGLYFESKPLIDTSYSSDAIKLYAAGIMREHSIGFRTVQAEQDHEKSVRIIKEVKLYEGSNVTMGANPETPFTGFKNWTPKEVNDQIKNIVKMLRHGDLTDEGFMQLEIALLQMQKSAVEYGRNSALESKRDPATATSKETDSLISVLNNYL